MSTYKVTFIVRTQADPSGILDAAHEAAADLKACIEALGSGRALIDEDETAVEEQGDDD
jgi:hypothetical protein